MSKNHKCFLKDEKEQMLKNLLRLAKKVCSLGGGKIKIQCKYENTGGIT